MMVSEKEALQKWCPFARVVSANSPDTMQAGQAAYNRMALPNDSSPSWNTAGNCIGPHCMAWQWNEDGEFRLRAEREFAKTGKQIAPDKGFCGLAGRCL